MLSSIYLDVVGLRIPSTIRIAKICLNYVIFSKKGQNMTGFDISLFLSYTVLGLIAYFPFFEKYALFRLTGSIRPHF